MLLEVLGAASGGAAGLGWWAGSEHAGSAPLRADDGSTGGFGGVAWLVEGQLELVVHMVWQPAACRLRLGGELENSTCSGEGATAGVDDMVCVVLGAGEVLCWQQVVGDL